MIGTNALSYHRDRIHTHGTNTSVCKAESQSWKSGDQQQQSADDIYFGIFCRQGVDGCHVHFEGQANEYIRPPRQQGLAPNPQEAPTPPNNNNNAAPRNNNNNNNENNDANNHGTDNMVGGLGYGI